MLGRRTQVGKRIDNAYLLTPVLGQLVMAVFPRRVATKWIRNAVGTNDVAHRFADVAVHAMSAGACFCLASLAQHLFGERVVDPVFAPVQTPSMALWGMADGTHYATDIQSTARLLPRASITEVPAAGHFVELEQPALFWQLLCEPFNLAS
jgi:pimeloyl-ACP methyl ester carboxylesterase